jgi:ADP-ribose pyrophosphatase YjhB (NUDIX family)
MARSEIVTVTADPGLTPPLRQPNWLSWARTAQALAQNGLTYAESPFDRDRYTKLAALADEIFATYTGLEAEQLTAWLNLQPGYITPKVDVRAACFRDGRLLLVRERSDGGWCLPGGWADVGDGPSQAAVREVQEEAGFTSVARKVIGVFDANRGGEPLSAYHAFKIIFACDITGGEAQPDHEILEVGWFDRSARPPLSGNRTTAAQLAECFAHLDDPARPTSFD